MYNIEKKGEDFDGCLRKLTEITKHQNLYESHDIVLSASSYSITGENISVTVDYYNTSISWWISTNKADSWYQIDLRNYKIKLKSYDYKAATFNFFETWTMQGSDNGIDWTDLDEQHFDKRDDSEIITLHLECNKNVNKAFTYFRLQVHGDRGIEKYNLAVYRMELYGVLYLNSYFLTFKHENEYKLSFSLIQIFLLNFS